MSGRIRFDSDPDWWDWLAEVVGNNPLDEAWVSAIEDNNPEA